MWCISTVSTFISIKFRKQPRPPPRRLILLDRAPADADSADHLAAFRERDAAREDDDAPAVARVNAEERLAGCAALPSVRVSMSNARAV
jgi:hypothetical protein